jgi:hypothetical protein
MTEKFDLTDKKKSNRLASEIIDRFEAFVALHKGHDIRQSSHREGDKVFSVECRTCGEAASLRHVIERDQ